MLDLDKRSQMYLGGPKKAELLQNIPIIQLKGHILYFNTVGEACVYAILPKKSTFVNQ